MTHHGADSNSIRPLRNVQRMVQLMDRLQTRAFGLEGMAVFYGPSGFGKTFAAIHCITSYGAIHVVVQDVWTKKFLLKKIAAELGIKPKGCTASISEQVQKGLSLSGRPLIVDEADRAVKRGMIELIRDIHDNTDTPVILVGEELLPQSLKRIERVHNRQLEWVAAEPADARDLKMLTDHYCDGVEIADELLARILAETNGSIRRITTNLARIKELSTVKGLKSVSSEEYTGIFDGEPPKGRGLS
ncbi:MAG: ATP-binding protein [Pseudomonadota bacterium]